MEKHKVNWHSHCKSPWRIKETERDKLFNWRHKVENSPNLEKETDIQIQEDHGVPKQVNPKRPTQRNIIIKMSVLKDRDWILKVARKISCMYKNSPIRPSEIFRRTLKYRGRGTIFKVLKEKNSNSKYSMWFEGEKVFLMSKW